MTPGGAMPVGADAAPAAERTSQASHVIRSWPSGVPFTVEAVLGRRPELAAHRTALVDLAYEEFCRLEEEGRGVAPSVFSARFPEIERSLRRVLALHEFCLNTPEVRDVLFDAPWPKPGTEIAGFLLDEEIGRGAASRVYLARDREVAGRRVVVKVGRGRQEADALGTLDHPGIVPVLSARSDAAAGLSVLCMPYLGRATLDGVIDQLYAQGPPVAGGRFYDAVEALGGIEAGATPRKPPAAFSAVVAKVGSDLAAALAHAHARGVTHADVKPSNVLVAPDGRPMLLDFNLARRDCEEAPHVGGTLPYMSPEHVGWWRGDGPPVAAPADIFSLGGTLYELLTGRLPFGPVEGGLSAAALLDERHRRGPEPIPSDRLQGNAALGRAVRSCLSYRPEARPSATELAAMLSRCTSGTAAVRQAVFMHRRKALALAAAGTLSAVSAAYGIARRPPHAERAWREGLLASEEGRDSDAADAFSEVLSSRPGFVPAFAARGWSRLRNGETDVAYSDLLTARKAVPGPRISAALGYCAALLAVQAQEAGALFEDALDGFDTAAVRNDLGCCFVQIGRLTQAELHLARAIEMDPGCGPAYYNFAILDLQLSVVEDRSPDLAYLRRALEFNRPSAALFLDAACVFAWASRFEPAYEADSERYCRSARDAGVPPRGLKQVATYLAERPERRWLDDLVSAPATANASAAELPDLLMTRLIAPFRDARDLVGDVSPGPAA